MNISYNFYGKTNKEKESIDNCQDAFQTSEKCFAIADGASDGGSYPDIWANLLVNHYCENPNITKENWKDWLKPIQAQWLNEVNEKIKLNKENNNPSWFYNKKKTFERKQPAGAAFIGVQVKENQFDIVIVGDCCLFIYQDKKIVKVIPYTKPADFGNFPEYFASFEKDNKFPPKFITYSIQNKKETYFILATDAFAKWIIENIIAKKNMFNFLISISSQNQFEDIINKMRKAEIIKLQNDDVALIVAKISEKKDNSNQKILELIDEKNKLNENTNNTKPILTNEEHIPEITSIKKEEANIFIKAFNKLKIRKYNDNISDI